MYKPTEMEKNSCIQIIKDILEIDNIVECEKYMDNIFRIAYSIGGDCGEKTLRSIAEILLKEVKSDKSKEIRTFIFRINADTESLKIATQSQVDRLSELFPDYNISATYGG